MQYEQGCSREGFSPRQRALSGRRGKALPWARGNEDSLVSLAPSPSSLLPPLLILSFSFFSPFLLPLPLSFSFLPLLLSLLDSFFFLPFSLSSSPPPLLSPSYLSLLTSSLPPSTSSFPSLPSFLPFFLLLPSSLRPSSPLSFLSSSSHLPLPTSHSPFVHRPICGVSR